MTLNIIKHSDDLTIIVRAEIIKDTFERTVDLIFIERTTDGEFPVKIKHLVSFPDFLQVYDTEWRAIKPSEFRKCLGAALTSPLTVVPCYNLLLRVKQETDK